jgi:hypothetical protein
MHVSFLNNFRSLKGSQAFQPLPREAQGEKPTPRQPYGR